MFDLIELSHLTFIQSTCIRLNLKIQHLVLVNYLWQFFMSGKADFRISTQNKQVYFRICLNKILNDLSILQIKKRRLQELILDLETAKIIKRLSASRHAQHVYIHLNLSEISLKNY